MNHSLFHQAINVGREALDLDKDRYGVSDRIGFLRPAERRLEHEITFAVSRGSRMTRTIPSYSDSKGVLDTGVLRLEAISESTADLVH